MSKSTEADCAGRRILIAGVGNIFLGDDGFGVEVVQRLMSRSYPQEVQVIDFGLRGVELAYTLLDDYDTLILVDATPRGEVPGTLYLIEPDLAAYTPEKGAEAGRVGLDAHSMDPVKVLAFALTLGARPRQTLLVGCEPSPFDEGEDYSEMYMGLSTPVRAAVDEAVEMIDALVEKLLEQAGEHGEQACSQAGGNAQYLLDKTNACSEAWENGHPLVVESRSCHAFSAAGSHRLQWLCFSYLKGIEAMLRLSIGGIVKARLDYSPPRQGGNVEPRLDVATNGEPKLRLNTF